MLDLNSIFSSSGHMVLSDLVILWPNQTGTTMPMTQIIVSNLNCYYSASQVKICTVFNVPIFPVEKLVLKSKQTGWWQESQSQVFAIRRFGVALDISIVRKFAERAPIHCPSLVTVGTVGMSSVSQRPLKHAVGSVKHARKTMSQCYSTNKTKKHTHTISRDKTIL